MSKELKLFEKFKILFLPGIIVWLIIFGLSLLMSHERWWVNGVVTLLMTLVCTLNMTSWQGEEYDPDKMP